MRYRRAGSEETAGPIVVESRVDIFESASGAGKDLDAYRDEIETLLADAPGAERVDDPELGDDALAITRTQDTALPVVFYNVIWREGNVTASLIAQGFQGKFSFDEALELARKQQRRIEEAAS